MTSIALVISTSHAPRRAVSLQPFVPEELLDISVRINSRKRFKALDIGS
jgi:hypothetical protein